MSYYVLTLYSKSNCAPCVATKFALEAYTLPTNVVLENKKLELECEQSFKSNGITSTPTLVLSKVNDEGQVSELSRHSGRLSEDDLDLILEGLR